MLFKVSLVSIALACFATTIMAQTTDPLAASPGDVEASDSHNDTAALWSSIPTHDDVTLVTVLPTSMITKQEHRSPGSAKKVLNVLGLFPLTETLDAGEEVRGEDAKIAAELAFEHINEHADILPDHELHLQPLNTMCHPGVGTKLFFEAVNSNTSYIMLLGSGCSEVAKTVSLAANLWNIVQVSYAASSPSLSNRETYASFYRTNVADSLYNYARLAIIKHYGWRRVATLYENREAFSTAVNLFTELLATNGINLTTSESFTVEPGEQISNLKEKGAWIIFGNFQETMARKVFCEAYKQKLYGKNYAWFLIGTYSARWWEKPDNSTSCTPAQIYAALDGYISTSALPMSLYPGDPTVSGYTASQLANDFAIRAEDAGLPGDVTTSASDAYDAAWSIALTLHEATSRGLASGTDELYEFSYSSAELKDAFMKTLYSLRFEGFSGSVSFTDTGDREGLIEIRQVRGERERVVGLYAFQQNDLAGTELNITGLQWSGDGPPKDQTTEEIVFATIPRLYLYVFGALCMAGILFVVCCFTVTVLYWDRS